MYEKIVVAIDGSDHAERALRAACDIAKKYDSKLHLVHSPQLETIAIAVGVSAVAIPPEEEKIQQVGKQVLDAGTQIANAEGCTPDSCTIGRGNPADDILQTISKNDADLVVMGRRGLGGVSAAILGSVSQKVSTGSDCSCLTVH